MDRGTMTRRELLVLLAALGVPASAVEAQTPARPRVPDAVNADPRSYKVLVENDAVRVVEHIGRPRMGVCGQGWHSHPDHVTIAMSDGRVKVTLADGKTMVGEQKAGEVWWEPASTHKVENVSGIEMRAVLVELRAGQTAPKKG
jgi:quercetin dioxygenase-like cupin family protein